ncbi:MAG TPA: inorganic diphosphatase [Chloroflexota bacterium]|nr:inorganic diphosphatase [Chloroflexota bacterium]
MAGNNSAKHDPYAGMPAYDEQSGNLNVVIETPKESRNKFKYDDSRGIFRLGGVLPAGAVFPFDFGFVPSTLAEDGDPLDMLVLMDESAFAGCLVAVRLIGVIEAEQTESGGTTERNDRLIGVASESKDNAEVRSLDQVNEHLVGEIEHFFVSYNQMRGKVFKPVGRFGPERARKLVDEGMARFKKPPAASGNGKDALDRKNSAAKAR